MRKYQQKQLLDILNTLREAHTEIKRNHSAKNTSAVLGILSDCQESAVQIGNFIEQLEGEGTKTVRHLAEYCELIYQISIEAGNPEADAGFTKQLSKKLFEIENSVATDLPIKREVVFFPYKASMWDSLESIWLAAKDDPDCDAYVVPIPYFDRLSDGALGKMHYEGSEYPGYVPVVDWKTYNTEERSPDVIFTHYAYDDAAQNASIHPDFYSKRLREHCGLLVYVPYFVVIGEVIPDYYGTTPGELYADRVILQSETIRQVYINNYKEVDSKNGWNFRFGKPKEKFIALGSPKIDKVLNTKREDFSLPEKWKRLIERPDGTYKKIILYNTHMFAWLNGGEQYFKKLRYVFDVFRSREDVVLWWRPHPNTELNFRTLRPQLLGEYMRLIAEYKRGKIGIYDDTPDLHRAIAFSDAYYGDWSSVVALYQCTGKPALIQNIDVKRVVSKKNELKAIIRDFIVKDNTIWFVTENVNGLFSMDLETDEVQLKGEIPFKGAFKEHLIASIAMDGDHLILVPGTGDNIVKYDMRSGAFELISGSGQVTPKFIDSYSFYDSYNYEGTVYMIPLQHNALVKYNVECGTITENKKICAEFDKYITDKDKTYFRFCTYVGDNILMLVPQSSNVFVKYNLKTDQYTFHRVGNEDNRYDDIAYDGSDYWLFLRKGNILKWNEREGIIAAFDRYPDDFKHGEIRNFRMAVSFNHDIFLFPGQANMILKVNAETNEIKEVVNLNERENDNHLNFKRSKYLCAKRVGESIYASSIYENSFQKINPKTGEIKNIPLILSGQDYSHIMHMLHADFVSDTSVHIENPVVTLAFYFDYLTSESAQKDDISKGNIPSENMNIAFVNADGSCGTKTYEYIKSIL